LLLLLALGSSAFAQTTLTPATLSFGNQGLNNTSAVKTATLENEQTGPLTISSIVISGGTAPADYAWGGNCPLSPNTLGAGLSCSITVTFTPSALGSRTASLRVTDNSPQTVSLTGTGVEPATTSETTLAFGKQGLHSTSAAKTVTLTNNDSTAITLSGKTIAGTNARAFAISATTCSTSLAGHASCTISVAFTPAATGALTATLSIADGATNSPQAVSLTGTGVEPATTSETTLAFGKQGLHSTSAAKTVTLTNNDSTAITLSGNTMAGTNASAFAISATTCSTSLAGHASCTISVTFTPAATGALTATLPVTDTAANSPQTVSLSGTGTAPMDGLSPASLAFGNQPVDMTSTAQIVTLTNRGNATLSITSLAVTGTNASDFVQTNNCGSSVAAAAKCTMSVTFTPAASGARTASLTITDNANGSPQTVSLTGTGVAPAVSFSPTSLSFGSQSVGRTSAAQTLTLTNTGSATLSITSLAVTRTNTSNFAVTDACGSSLAAGAKCTISVTFKPAVSGARAAALSITDNASGSPQTVNLSGTGTSTAAMVSLSAASLAFGNQPVDTTSAGQAVTLTNTGNATLSISSLTVTGTNASDFAQTNTCSNSVAAGAHCTIAVMFTPSASGARTAAVSITGNASGSPQTVSLSGTGSHDVILSWTASATPGVMGYDVYRGTTSHGESSTPLNSTPINGTTYTDENVMAGVTYYYVVTAVASNGVTQSADSSEAAATVPRG
jgi:hypothetical protein